jgi:hypothetical protein
MKTRRVNSQVPIFQFPNLQKSQQVDSSSMSGVGGWELIMAIAAGSWSPESVISGTGLSLAINLLQTKSDAAHAVEDLARV